MAHKLPIRVYYEDTDMGGIVYYANYLKFIERGRSDWVREQGVDQRKLLDEEGIVFAVRRMEADYLAPAKLDDLLIVETETLQLSGARWLMEQKVTRDGDILFHAVVTIVAINETGHPTRMPDCIRRLVH